MSPPYQKRAKVVLVGCGCMGKTRAELLYANPRFNLIAVVDMNFDVAKALAEKYESKPFKTLSEALEYFGARRTKSLVEISIDDTSSFGEGSPRTDEDTPDIADTSDSSSSSTSTDDALTTSTSIDGVVISSPTFTHRKLVMEAASHGLPIFIEKPIDETADKIEDVFAACKEAEVALCCGFQRRFDPSYVATAKAVHSGEIGTPLSSTIFFGDSPCPPKEFLLAGGNIFADLSVHDIDYIRWVLRDEVASVYATGTLLAGLPEEAGVHGNATIVMKFKRGALVTLTLNRLSCYGYDQRCEIFGDKGLVQVGNEHAHGSTLSNDHGVHNSLLKNSFPQRYREAYATELDAFADTILMNNPWPITAKDCIAVQKISDAARESCELNRVVEMF